MSEALDKYLSLLDKFKKTHEANLIEYAQSAKSGPFESNEEDSLLDEMDVIWWDLTDEERAKLQEP
jgi:uncharacterized protein HemY